MSLTISCDFDSGSIEVVRTDAPDCIELKLRPDVAANFSQWFHFRLQGAAGQACVLRILNAGDSTYPSGWASYHACASEDGVQWKRVSTAFDGKVLTISHTPLTDSIDFAYFEPYTWDRHLRLLEHAARAPQCEASVLGHSLRGRELTMLTAGNPDAGNNLWIIARQHPGEAMAEWFVEGMLEALLDSSNAIARELLGLARIHIVPNMNPDGSVAGNLRTNAAGADLNRAWMAPSRETTPEVFLVREKIHETGCDLFLDIHGDEGLPYVFIAGSEMLESISPRQVEMQRAFVADLMRASPEFQNRVGYPPGKYSQDLLKLASKYVAHHFGCLSLTLEMPFKDNAHRPDPAVGWNGARSAALGRAVLEPMLLALKRGG